MKVTSILLAAIAAFTTTSDAVQYDNNRQWPEWSEETFDKISHIRRHANEKRRFITEINLALSSIAGDNDITVTKKKEEALSNTLTDFEDILVKLDEIRSNLDALA